MKKFLKLALIFSIVTLILLPTTAGAASSGTCGASVNWTLSDNGTLTISGTGEMSSFIESTLPWKDLRSSIKNVVVGEGVTSVGGTSFLNCTNLVSVSLPQSIIEIEGSAFSGCTGLTTINFPDSLTSISGNAFYNCQSLTSITIPQNVTGIGAWAFHSCFSLSRINWNAKNVADFESSAGTFANAGRDTSGITIVFGNGVQSIPAYAFRSCSKVTDITVPESITYIGEYAFEGTAYYENSWSDNAVYIGAHLIKVQNPTFSLNNKFEVKNGTKYISSSAFSGVTEWKNVIVPESVLRIDEGAFYNCSNIESITLPFVGASETATSYDAVLGYIFGRSDEGTTVQNYKGGSDNYNIPSTLKTVTLVGVEKIGYGAFSGCKNLTGVSIPSSVTEIGPIAFSNCTGLTSIIIPASVKTIGNSAFSGCSKLTGITIPDSVTSINNFAFADCDKLASVTIPATVTNIGDWVFSGCDVLNNVTWPAGVTKIGGYTFYNCSGLNNITIPDSVTGIGENAFYGTGYYNDGEFYLGSFLIKADDTIGVQYQIKDGTKYIADGAFRGLNLITNVIIPESLLKIGEHAFYNCDGLTNIVIPDSVTHINDWAFFGCDNLALVTFGEGVLNIGKYAFANCPALSGVVLPDGITDIGESAFSYCDGLTSITIPDSMTDIAYRLFYDCDGLTEAVIGRNVKTIGGYTFGDNDKLQTVVIPKSVTNIMAGAFERCNSIKTVTYDGDNDLWKQIEIDILNECIFNIKGSIDVEIIDGVFYVTPSNLRQNNAIVFACYEDDKMVYVKTYIHDTDKGAIPFTPDVDYNKVKVMLWDSLSGMSPIGEGKISNISSLSANISFTSTPNAVTNVNTTEMITVNFSSAINMETVNGETVYAVALEDKKNSSNVVSIASGAVYPLGGVIKEGVNNSFKIDVASLPSHVKFRLVVDGILTKTGKRVDAITGEFTTGVIANIPYMEGKMIKNVAKDATIRAGEEISGLNDKLSKWLDDNVNDLFNFSGKDYPNNYAIVDLGDVYDISSVGVQLTWTPWHSGGTSIFLKESLNGVSYSSLTSADAKKLLVANNDNALVYDDMVDHAVISGSTRARYIILKEEIAGSNKDFQIKKIYAFSREGIE